MERVITEGILVSLCGQAAVHKGIEILLFLEQRIKKKPTKIPRNGLKVP